MIERKVEFWGDKVRLLHPIVNIFYFGRFGKSLELVSSEFKETVLDVGCGIGYFLRMLTLQCDEAIGLDPNLESLRYRDSGGHLCQGIGECLPFSNNSFDIVFALGIIEHAIDESRFLEEIKRVLRPQGVCIITVPIDVGVGGLLRRIVASIVFGVSFSYSFEELFAKTPREKHQKEHRYYNWKYTIHDLKMLFKIEHVVYFPIPFLRILNPIIIMKVRK